MKIDAFSVCSILLSAAILSGCEAKPRPPINVQSEAPVSTPGSYVAYGADGGDVSMSVFLPCQKEPDFAKELADDDSKIVIEYYNSEYTLSDYDTWSAHFCEKLYSREAYEYHKTNGELEEGISDYKQYKEHYAKNMGVDLSRFDDPVLPAGAVIFYVQAYKDDEALPLKKLALDGFCAGTNWLSATGQGNEILQLCADKNTSGGIFVFVCEEQGYVRVQLYPMAGDMIYEGFYKYQSGDLTDVDDNTGISIFGVYE